MVGEKNNHRKWIECVHFIERNKRKVTRPEELPHISAPPVTPMHGPVVTLVHS